MRSRPNCGQIGRYVVCSAVHISIGRPLARDHRQFRMIERSRIALRARIRERSHEPDQCRARNARAVGRDASAAKLVIDTAARQRYSMPRLNMGRSDRRRELLPGTLEMLILQTLRRAPLHGYAIAQSIQQTSGELLQVEEGSLYPALQRLLREEWVTAEWKTSATNRRVRTYRLTASGRKQLEREVCGFERLLEGIARVMRPSES